jgi:hypothetical protein
LMPVVDAPVEVPSTPEEPTAWKPVILDRFLHVAQLGYGAVERRYIGRRGMTPKIIVVHIQEGVNMGSWQHFHAVSASSTILIGMNGDIWRLVPESDAPWTNGDVNVPTAIGREVINKWGPDPNVYTLSIENEGTSNARHTQSAFEANKASMEKQIRSNVWQIKTWMQKYNIPKVYVIRHKDISTVGKPQCPGDAFFNALMARLDGASVPVEVIYTSPSIVEEFDGSKDVMVRNSLFHAEKRTVTANLATVYRRLYAGQTSAEVGAPYKSGQTFDVLGWVEGELTGGEKRWWIGKDYSRVWVGATKEKPADNVPVESYPDTTPTGVKIVNGVMYYQAFEPNTNVARRFTVKVEDATIRDQPSTKGRALGKAVKGQELIARWWCFGEEVKGDRIWWLLDSDADPFTDPQYIWGNVSEERPD